MMTTQTTPTTPTTQPVTESTPSPLKFLEGKNVLVFDTETTGLPERCPNGWGTYWSYFMNEKYNSSRIISIAWSTIHNFHKDKIYFNTSTSLDSSMSPAVNSLPSLTINDTTLEPLAVPFTEPNSSSNQSPLQHIHIPIPTTINHYLRYPEGFTEINNSHIHGITYEETINNGVTFNDLLMNKGLCVDILKSDYLVAHNINFDYHILMNELYRLDTEYAQACILHLTKLKSKGRLVCTGEISTDICKMEFKTVSTYKGNKKTKRYKMPKLSELYVYYYGKEFENQHSADGDVKALLEIMTKI
jgi:DNA polymerase III epsilon subunit-like protein